MASRRVMARKCDDRHLELLEPVEVPENTQFAVTIDLPGESGQDAPSLKGSFPQLRSITDADFEAAKRIWDNVLLKQLEILQGKHS